MEKENVYEQNTQAETVARATEPTEECGAEKESLAVLGKFKDVDALVRAYENLEAEFTRRSQKLKVLEKQAEQFAREKEQAGADNGVEKLRKNALQRRKEAMEFDKFVADVYTANACADVQETQNDDVNSAMFLQAGTRQNGAADAQALAVQTADPKTQTSGQERLVEQQTAEDGENASAKEKTRVASVGRCAKSVELSSDELFAKVNADESVRLRIIGEYLSSIGKTAAPLMQGGTGTLAMPPMKPKSFSDAGNMALRFFKKDGVEA